MSNSNTSFEHVLHNLQERTDIINRVKTALDQLLQRLAEQDQTKTHLMMHAMVKARIDPLFDKYSRTVDRFNIGIIPFVADYYDIIDRHSDQFHFKYLHNYSSHIGHYTPILDDCGRGKFDIQDLISIFDKHCYSMPRFKIYSSATMAKLTREKIWTIYQNLSKYIATENVYDLSDLFMYEFELVINTIKTLGDAESSKCPNALLSNQDMAILMGITASIQQFGNIKLDFKPAEEILDYCECGNVMLVMPESSELVCDNCGYLYELKGTVFNDYQFYSQESIRYKHAGYEPSKHVKSWLERIQARETNTITNEQLMKIEACIKRDGITNKKRLSIEQLRCYLKDSGLTELNEHVALIKRLITGIAPPQLTYAETQDITNSFAKAVKAYNIIRPSNKSNMLFYPYIVWKLIEMHVADSFRKKSLLSFIHLQGAQTLIQNDTLWARICNITKGFKYIPTDRYAYLD